MIYYGEFERNQALGDLLKDLFYNQQNEELFDVLDSYTHHKNF